MMNLIGNGIVVGVVIVAVGWAVVWAISDLLGRNSKTHHRASRIAKAGSSEWAQS